MSEKKDACEHGVPNPSWAPWTYDTKIEMQEPMWRTILIDSRDCPSCLKDRIKNLRKAFMDALYAFAPKDAPRPRVDAKLFSAAFNAYNDDLKKWGP